MKDNQSEIIDLIGRVLSKEASREEINELEEWKLQNSENSRFFNDFQAIWDDYGLLNEAKKINIDNEWGRFEKYIDNTDNKTNTSKTQTKKQRTFVFYSLRIAAILIIGIFLSVIIYKVFDLSDNKKIAASNEIRELLLNDGTKITININSKFNYPVTFEGNLRKVKLEGEAFFEVARDTVRPFIVDAGDMQVKVLGTSFNIVAYDGTGKVEVYVKSGKVLMSSSEDPDKKIVIEAGQKGEFDKNTGNLKQSVNEDDNYIAWKTKTFDFKDENLEKVVEVLNKVYHKNIVIQNDGLKKCPLTVKFENQSLDAILKVISKTLDIQVQDNDNQIILIGKGC